MIKNNNYETVFEREVADLSSYAYLLRHKKTGARVFILSNDDDNKVFYIGFRTPPSDSTGVAHITEHAVLCGSEKYPLKDPFVELAKGSLNTFLNAMTYPDKTVYPVASPNDQDFKNLMSVYMDAVFHPNTYKRPEILKQEGWHYELNDPEDPITYNGVVYNEMKGAFSSPDSVLDREVLNSLFPDSAYGVESGGDPESIPDLTYDAFLDFHRKYYHPSNSYIYLYGDMDIEERLAWMDEEYLGRYDMLEIDSSIKYQKPFGNMREVIRPYPITDDEDEEENTYISYNIVCGNTLDVEMVFAIQMLDYALIDMHGAPIWKRLFDEGIGKDVISGFDDGVLQPYLYIAVKNSDPGKKERFLEIIREEFEKAADKGVDRKSLTASLNSLKFKYREADFGGTPKGLIYGLSCLKSWLYDDGSPLLHIELSDVFDRLEKGLESSYYEDIIRKYFLDESHTSLVMLVPEKGLTAENEQKTADKLAAYKASLSEEEIAQLVEDTRALAAYQEEPSSPEALETIPLLKRSDIKRDVEPFSNIISDVDGAAFLGHEYNTNGIAYVSLAFDANSVCKDLFPYLGLVRSVISFTDTENYSYTDLNNEINIAAGSLSFSCDVYRDRKDQSTFSMLLDVSLKVLYENIDRAFDLIEEVIFASKLRDEKRLYEIIASVKSSLQSSMLSGGHVYASSRAGSYFNESYVVKELLSGIEFYRFIERIEKDFDAEKDKLMDSLEQIMKICFASDGILISCTASPEGIELVKKRCAVFKKKLDAFTVTNRGAGYVPDTRPVRERTYDFYGNGFTLAQKNEAFRTSGLVNYLCRAGRFCENGDQVKGSVNVFHNIMQYEYLWLNIRVQGGAYGCMCASSPSGITTFVTYRDPNIKRSFDVFEKIPDYLESFDCSEREMTKFVIGAISASDVPLTPYSKGVRDWLAYLHNTDISEYRRIREEMIDCTQEDIRALAPMIRKALSEGNVCCVGNESKIEEDKDLFKNVRTLFE